MLSIASMVPDFILSHPGIFIGYATAVLFPVPFLNSTIIAAWSKFGSKITALISGTTTTVETTVETAIEGASVTAINTALSGGTGVATVMTGSTATTIVAAPAAVVAKTTTSV